MTPSDKNLIERCEADANWLTPSSFQQLLTRFKELAMVDLREVEDVVQIAGNYMESYRKINKAKYVAELRKAIGYTTHHLNTEGEE